MIDSIQPLSQFGCLFVAHDITILSPFRSAVDNSRFERAGRMDCESISFASNNLEIDARLGHHTSGLGHLVIWDYMGLYGDYMDCNGIIWIVMGYGCVWKCCVPLFTQWFCWSLSLWKMAISLGILTQHFQTNPFANVNSNWSLMGFEPHWHLDVWYFFRG